MRNQFLNRFALLAACSATISIGSAQSPLIADAKLNELPILLFGQHCTIQGPFDDHHLKAIHGISPEQVPVIETVENARTATSQLKGAFEKLQDRRVASAFQNYIDLQQKRIEAQKAFLDALSAAKRAGKPSLLVDETRKHLVSEREKPFVEETKKLDKKDLTNATAIEKLRLAYDDAIQPDPEDIFHAVSKGLGIRYSCNFEGAETEEHSH